MSLIKSVIYHILDSPSVDIQYIGPEGNISALGYASADILPSGPIYCISTSGGPIYIIYALWAVQRGYMPIFMNSKLVRILEDSKVSVQV